MWLCSSAPCVCSTAECIQKCPHSWELCGLSVLNAPEHDVLLQLLSGATNVSHCDVPESPAGDFPFLLYPASPKLLSCNFQVPAILFLEDGDIFCFSGPRTVPGVWAASFEPTQHCGSGPSRHQSSTAGSSGAQSITHSSG